MDHHKKNIEQAFMIPICALILYGVALVISVFVGGDFREIVRELIPAFIIFALALISFFLLEIVISFD